MTVVVFVLLALNLVNLFVDTPIWYTTGLGIASIIVFILIVKNSNIIRRLKKNK